jgi:hypothetical protein
MENTTKFLPETIKEINEIQNKLNKTNGLEIDEVKQIFLSCSSKNRGCKAVRGRSR